MVSAQQKTVPVPVLPPPLSEATHTRRNAPRRYAQLVSHSHSHKTTQRQEPFGLSGEASMAWHRMRMAPHPACWQGKGGGTTATTTTSTRGVRQTQTRRSRWTNPIEGTHYTASPGRRRMSALLRSLDALLLETRGGGLYAGGRCFQYRYVQAVNAEQIGPHQSHVQESCPALLSVVPVRRAYTQVS